MFGMKRKNRASILVVLAAALTLAPRGDAGAAPQGAIRIDGEMAGTEYVLVRPEAWNGDLVLLVHGSIPDDFEALAPGLVAQGFAVAFVTLTPSVGDGDGDAYRKVPIATQQARARFVARFGPPDKTYLFGFSRGAHNMTRMLDTSPDRYDGMLSICGANGGTQQQLDYFFNARVLFDYHFPGVLPGSALQMPELDLSGFLGTIAPLVLEAIARDPGAAVELAAVDQYSLAYQSFDELALGILQSLLIHSISINGIIDAMHGNPFENRTTVYAGTSDDDALNAGIARLAADPQARRYAANWHEPDGSIGGTPVILLHTSRDPIVPEPANNDRYASLVEEGGQGEFLLRRVVDRFGHCSFTPEEIFGSFADLVTWAETGWRPDP